MKNIFWFVALLFSVLKVGFGKCRRFLLKLKFPIILEILIIYRFSPRLGLYSIHLYFWMRVSPLAVRPQSVGRLLCAATDGHDEARVRWGFHVVRLGCGWCKWKRRARRRRAQFSGSRNGGCRCRGSTRAADFFSDLCRPCLLKYSCAIASPRLG